MNTKFKVGDKVKILPAAMLWHVPKDEVDKFGVIVPFPHSKNYQVYMDKPRKQFSTRAKWVVLSSYIEIAVKPGQQLEFAFMEKEG